MQKVLGKSAALLAKKQVDLIGIANVCVAIFCLGGKAEKVGIGMLLKEVLHAVVVGNIQLMPVVQSRALEFFVVNGEAKRTDQMKRRARCGAGARNISIVNKPVLFGQVSFHTYPPKLQHALISMCYLSN